MYKALPNLHLNSNTFSDTYTHIPKTKTLTLSIYFKILEEALSKEETRQSVSSVPQCTYSNTPWIIISIPNPIDDIFVIDNMLNYRQWNTNHLFTLCPRVDVRLI